MDYGSKHLVDKDSRDAEDTAGTPNHGVNTHLVVLLFKMFSPLPLQCGVGTDRQTDNVHTLTVVIPLFTR